MACLTKGDPVYLEDEIDTGKEQVKAWMNAYYRNRWENQPYYPEVFIEKKALEGVFYKTCKAHDVALAACKGYPSLTFLHEASIRFKHAEYQGKQPVIIYFGDYDPSGEDIPRALQENLENLGVSSLIVKRVCLNEDQVIAWGLPPAPTKVTDSRSVHWEGLGQVELDAVKPEKLMDLLEQAIADIFDDVLYGELMAVEREEREEYREELKEYVASLGE